MIRKSGSSTPVPPKKKPSLQLKGRIFINNVISAKPHTNPGKFRSFVTEACCTVLIVFLDFVPKVHTCWKSSGEEISLTRLSASSAEHQISLHSGTKLSTRQLKRWLRRGALARPVNCVGWRPRTVNSPIRRRARWDPWFLALAVRAQVCTVRWDTDKIPMAELSRMRVMRGIQLSTKPQRVDHRPVLVCKGEELRRSLCRLGPGIMEMA